MSGIGSQRHSGATQKHRERRREVESCLARWGLVRGPRRLRSEASAGDGVEEGFSGRLRTVLETLGPVFSSFGTYLSTRVDLFTVGDCLELAATARPAPWPIASIHRRIEAELGRDPAEIFESFEAEPVAARLTVQLHRARLHGGREALVWVVPMEAEAIVPDLELLSLLVPAFTARGWDGRWIKDAIADYRRTLEASRNLREMAEALELLAADAETFGVLRVARIDRQLSTSAVLSMDEIGGVSFEAIGRSTGEGSAASGRDLARRLGVVWLRQVLHGRVFPLDPGAAEAVVSGDQVGFRGGLFEEPPSTFQRNLLEYLIAVALHQPDEACTHLVREMTQDETADLHRLRLRLRQVVPFREGSWSPGGDSLAEHVFIHARLARTLGYRPCFHLLAFYRGLFSVAAIARRLAPEHDVLREALEEVRLQASLNQMRDAVSFSAWGQHLETYARLAVEMPQKLDELLTLAVQGHARPGARATETPTVRRRQGSASALPALLPALAAIALLTRHLMAVGFAEPWTERIGAALFLIFGALLFLAVGRTSRGARR